MNTLLLIVTGVSVVVAGLSAGLAWRVARRERERTAARVAALAAAAGVPQPAPARTEPARLDSVAPSNAVPSGGTAIFPRPAVDSGSSGRQHGLALAAVAFGVIVLTSAGLVFVSGRSPGASPAPVRTPLELLSLGHARTDGVLAVSGVVQNPANGSAVERLDAQVRVFDAAGLVIATRTARVEAATLAPGQHAPFSVPVGEAAAAARYRVSFTSDGSMLPHVDRRTNAPAAVTAEVR